MEVLPPGLNARLVPYLPLLNVSAEIFLLLSVQLKLPFYLVDRRLVYPLMGR